MKFLGLNFRDPAANSTTIRFALAWLILLICGILVSLLIVPGVIASAYRGQSLQFFNHVISGQALFPVEKYLSDWNILWIKAALAWVLAGVVVILFVRPEVREWARQGRNPSELFPSVRLYIVALLAVTAIAAAMRFSELGKNSYWIDETLSATASQAPWSEFWRELRIANGGNMALYFLLLRGWVHLFGDGEAAVRTLSALFSIATIPAIYALGRRLAGRTAGFFSAILLAVNGFHLMYAQEARAYSLLALLVTLSSLYWLRSLETPTWRNWSIYALVSAGAVYSHYFAGLVLLAHVISLPAMRNRPKHLQWLFASAATGLLILPAAWIVLTTSVQAQLGWLAPLSADQIYGVFTALAGNGGSLLFLAYVALGAVALLQHPREAALPLIWFSVPMALVLVLTVITPSLVDRYMIICLPAMTLLAGIGVASIPRPASIVALAAVVFLSGAADTEYFRHYRKDDFRGAVNFIAARERPSDGVLFYHPRGEIGFGYYWRRLHQPLPELIPFGKESLTDLVSEVYPGPMQPDQIKRCLQQHDRVWFVIYHANLTPDRTSELTTLTRTVETRYPISSTYKFTNIEVRLFQTARKD